MEVTSISNLGLVALLFGACATLEPSLAQDANSIVPREGLAIANVVSRRRGGIDSYDPIETMMIRGELENFQPQPDDPLTLNNGDIVRWKTVELDENGSADRQALGRGGYLYVTVHSETDRVMILQAGSHGGLYFNGVPHTANVYGYAYYHLPVRLQKGANRLLLRSGRRNVQAKLYSPPAPSFLLEGDKTLPDLVFDELADTWGAVIVVNSSTTVTTDLALAVHGDQLNRVVTPLPSIPPLSIRKVGFRIQAHPLDPDVKTIDGHLELLHGSDDTPLHTVPLSLRVRETYAARKRTFLSDIDGSVQYYALRRAVPRSEDDPPPALVLSCHGAGVEGIGQAAAYSSKSWLHLVAPTNRRPYGFDWEDVGRADAMEVLRIAKASLRHDPARIYLTGHSMGGHGTWHLGSLYPDTFAAIGPSAGWISYRGYARRGADADDGSPVKDLLRRGEKIGDPTELAVNLKHHGVYVLHGGDDRNVPVNQAERMAELLGNMHRDWSYHEEPGKGHWWSNELDDGGATCMDWPPMYDCFARHAIPPAAAVRHVEFATANPGVSNRCYWVSIEGQLRHQDVSRVNLHTWPNKRRFQGTTENVAVLGLDVGHLMSTGPITIDLDGQHLEKIADPEDGKMLWLRNVAGDWRLTEKPLPLQKGPHRYGAIKNELRNRFVFVYGTRGTEEENKWVFAKARLDGETFWYRGNGSIDMIADAEFDPDEYADRTIVVYGNAETNSAWHKLLKECPVHVQRDRITLGEQTITGDDLAVLFVQPRRDSDTAAVIVIAGTGPTGMRLACKQSLFVPFIRYPDCVVLSTRGLEAGSATVELAGYFGLDWSVENGEFLWHEDP